LTAQCIFLFQSIPRSSSRTDPTDTRPTPDPPPPSSMPSTDPSTDFHTISTKRKTDENKPTEKTERTKDCTTILPGLYSPAAQLRNDKRLVHFLSSELNVCSTEKRGEKRVRFTAKLSLRISICSARNGKLDICSADNIKDLRVITLQLLF
jgi:hypothetical protein